MFHYTLLFKYGDDWHMDHFERDTQYDINESKERIWLVEAARFAVERLNLQNEKHRLIKEAILFPTTIETEGASKTIIVNSTPVYALHDIEMMY